MAWNTTILADQDGQFSDWIELSNPGPSTQDLGGFYLTDEATFPAKWRIPTGVVLPAGGFQVIFASGKDRAVATNELHTNFRLNKGGGYLALVATDGLTVLQVFNHYPSQQENVSFGPSPVAEALSLVNSNTVARLLVPADGSLGATWTGTTEPFDDSAWLGGWLPAGYDTGIISASSPLSNKLASTSFAYRYEMDLPGYVQDLDSNGTNDWATNSFPSVSSGFANGTNNLVCDANFTNSIWRAQFSTNFTAEFSVQVLTSGTEGTYGTLSLTASKGSSTAPWLNIKRNGQSWGTTTPTLLGSELNTDVQHLFRLAREGNNCWVWRDHVLLNPGGAALAPSTPISSGTNALLLGDNSLNGNNGAWKLDFLRLQPGAFAPAVEPNLFGSLIRTDLRSAMFGVSASAYVRVPFVVPGLPAQFTNLLLRLKCDDGFVAYVNGVEVARRNAPASPAWDSVSATNRTDTLALTAETIDLTAFIPTLVSGSNLLAIHALNSAADATRFLLSAELDGVKTYQTNLFFTVATPGSSNTGGALLPLPKVDFSLNSQLFTNSLTLSLSNAVPGAAIYFTRNGTVPATTNGTLYTTPLAITNSGQIRAVAVLAGYSASPVKSECYLKVGSDLANFSSPLPIVVLHNFGAGAVPGVSSRGPNGDGSQVVQSDSQAQTLVILDRGTNGLTTFANPLATATRAGLRIHGSSAFNNTKKSYTLETWGEADQVGRDVSLLGLPADNDWVLYGPSWKNPTGSADFDAALIHNSFIYELARESGYYTPRTRFVELFLNTNIGPVTATQYVGLFVLTEKVKRAADRVDIPALSPDGTSGGWMINCDRMDSLPPGSVLGSLTPRHFHTAGPDRSLQTTNDNARGFKGISYLLTGGTSTDTSGLDPARDDIPNRYHSFFNFESPGGWEITVAQRTAIENFMRGFDAALYGPDYTNATTGYSTFIDVDNWVHHYILQNFPKNQDAEVLSTYFVRESATAKLKHGPVWDYDRAYNKNPTSGVASNNLEWVRERLFYLRLFTDPDFKQAYTDKWQQLRRGSFSDSNLLAIVDRQTNEITGIVPAREGILDWPARIGTFKQWLTNRSAALDGQFLKMPVFNQEGGAISNGFTVTLTNLNAGGTLFFTLDGSDPRARGGSVAPAAQAWPQSIVLNATTVLRARVQSGTNWSGLAEAVFYTSQDFVGLALTEIMFNPPDIGATSGDNFEFLELKNTGTNTLNLSGLYFSAGITFTFTNGTTLAPGQVFLLARNASAMAAKYPGVAVNGIYTGKLDNAGETITLSTALGTPIFSVTYDDTAPWPIAADGYGFSLVPGSLGASQAPDDGSRWRASTSLGGSPGTDDPAPALPAVVINEILTHPGRAGDTTGSWPSAVGYPDTDAIELWTLSSSPADISGWFLTDDVNAPRKFRIPDGTMLASGGFVTFNETDFNPTPGTNLSFSLSSLGESVYLFSADTNGNLTGYSHGFVFGASARGVSFGRYINSVGEEQFPAQLSLTLGGTNRGPRVGPAVISQIMYHPPTNGVEFIEIANITAEPLPLFDSAFPTNTWRLTGAGFSFPTNVTLPANSFALVVATNPEVFRARYVVPAEVPVFGPLTGVLQDSGELLKLERPDPPTNGTVPFIGVDEVRYNDKAPWPPAADGSGPALLRLDLSAYGNDPTNWAAPGPTIFCADIVTNTAAGDVIVHFAPRTSYNCAVTNVACVPPSGSAFTLGTTLVNCTAVDDAGNSAECQFNVEVQPPQVTGLVGLEGFVGPMGDGYGSRTVTFKATDDTGTVLASWVLALSFSPDAGHHGVASYVLTNVPSATTHLSAKAAWNLRKRLPVSFASGAAVADFVGAGVLPGGDINNSNLVDIEDYFQLAAAWYKSVAAADIDGSGLVEMNDFSILAARWYQQGDPE